MHEHAALLALMGCVLAHMNGEPRAYRIFHRKFEGGCLMYLNASRWDVHSPTGAYDAALFDKTFTELEWFLVPDHIWNRLPQNTLDTFVRQLKR